MPLQGQVNINGTTGSMCSLAILHNREKTHELLHLYLLDLNYLFILPKQYLKLMKLYEPRKNDLEPIAHSTYYLSNGPMAHTPGQIMAHISC